MRTKERLTVTVDKGTQERVGKVLEQFGMKTSSYVNVVLRALIDSETKTLKQVYEDLGEGLVKSVSAKEKKGKRKRL